MSGSQQLLLGGAPTVTPVDPYFYSVTSLLHGDGTNGGQNNTFLDSSTNNFTITRNGNTTQGSFSPFSQTGWSNNFDGNGDYLTFTGSSALTATGDFTFECWIYVRTIAQTGFSNPRILTSPSGLTLVLVASTNNLRVDNDGTGTSPISTANNSIIFNQWMHVAVVRSGSTLTAYLNGTAAGSATHTSTFTETGSIGIGYTSVGPGGYFDGYISNMRMVVGTAVYTANFTPPTAALTAITNTQLLTCQSNRFRDASTNNFTITANGDVSVQPFSPFNPTTAYSASSIGGSGYFDGSGDYLSAGVQSAFNLGTSDFSFEGWVYPFAVDKAWVSCHQAGNADGWYSYLNPPRLEVYSNGGGGGGVSSNVTPPVNAWCHILFTRQSGRLRVFVNGVLTGTTTNSYTINQDGRNFIIGAITNGLAAINAYISNFRLVNGSVPTDYQTSATSLGTLVFTPSTSPFTTTSQGATSGDVKLLLNYTNGAIFDNAAVADYETVGNAQISTSVKKYGTGSMSFDGTGDYLVTDAPSTDLFAFGTGDFTIEFWLYLNSTSGTPIIYDGRPSATNGAQPTIYMNGAVITYYTNAGNRITGSSLSASTWYHVALCRVASQTKMFVNGTQVGATYADTTAYTNTAGRPVYGVDGNSGNTNYFNGYIDDLRISKGVGRYAYNFTPPTAALPDIGGTITLTADPYYEYTTLLLPGNGTNGAQNNTFLDSSTNAFTITRNGNTTQGTFSPFSQTGWGNYFDGTGDYLETPSNAAFTLGSSGDFTIECWVYLTATSGNYAAFLTTWADALSNYTNRWWVGTNADGILRWYDSSGNTGIVDSVVLTLNTWFHVAVVRSGSTITLYKNGTAVGTQTTNQAYTTQGSVKMGYSGTNSGYYFGYISNARVVKGTAVYTANFTPPTTPLTAITNTSLLTCQSNRFIDNSTNNFTITRNGDVSVQAFSPFNPTASWSAATYGGSGYFDGSGDYLVGPNNAAFNFGTGDFCVEFWIYPSDLTFRIYLSSADNAGTQIGYDPGNGPRYLYFYNGSNIFSGQTAGFLANQWNHIALCRSGTTLSMYCNGTRAYTNAAYSSNISFTTPYVGEYNALGYPTLGYISNLRLVKGASVYTPSSSTLTVPTAPLTAIANTSLLLNMTNAGIYDATSKNDLETVGNAQISTTQSKFGGSSMYFDGTGDYLYARNNQDLNLGTGDFTCECWVYVTSWSNANPHLFAKWNDGGNGYAYKGRILSSGASLRFGTGNNGTLSTEFDFSGANLSLNTWYHIAFTRYGSSLKAFVNGVQIGSTQTTSNSLSSNSAFLVGAASDGGLDYIFGYIDDLRITKGIARYTSNFTPPTTAFLTL